NNTDEPLHIKYRYERKDYSGWSQDQTGPPLGFIAFVQIPESEIIEHSIALGPAVHVALTARMELPKNFSIAAPRDFDARTDFAEYHTHYVYKDGTLLAERRFV